MKRVPCLLFCRIKAQNNSTPSHHWGGRLRGVFCASLCLSVAGLEPHHTSLVGTSAASTPFPSHSRTTSLFARGGGSTDDAPPLPASPSFFAFSRGGAAAEPPPAAGAAGLRTRRRLSPASRPGCLVRPLAGWLPGWGRRRPRLVRLGSAPPPPPSAWAGASLSPGRPCHAASAHPRGPCEGPADTSRR